MSGCLVKRRHHDPPSVRKLRALRRQKPIRLGLPVLGLSALLCRLLRGEVRPMNCPGCNDRGTVADPVGEYGMQTVYQTIDCPTCCGREYRNCDGCGDPTIVRGDGPRRVWCAACSPLVCLSCFEVVEQASDLAEDREGCVACLPVEGAA